LVIKDFQDFRPSAGQLDTKAYATELGQFKWQLHADYANGSVSFYLIADPPKDFKGGDIIYE
jgi:hypothetical protein